ncbi:MAG: EAL domain-containing protein [Campylobacteraceae bacterium]|nr:EAL domain-containing protein [Campylobacteraceae bacterium]
MSLSKQLYIIISFIFFMIFAGNFLISVKNTREYLESESVTKAQDTATSLGMTLKALLKNKKDPEIESILRAIGNRGFYKEIRLEDTAFTFLDSDIIENNTKLSQDFLWEINEVSVDVKYGSIQLESDDDDFGSELLELEEESSNFTNIEDDVLDNVYTFIPSKDYINGGTIPIKFSASYEGELVNAITNLDLNKVLVNISRDVKFESVPQWFIDYLPMQMPEKKSEISDGWKTTATIYVSANPGEAYAKLYEQAEGAIFYAIVAFAISIVLLIIFLRFILQPLNSIETLASSIAQGKFETIKKLPWTTEIRNVAIAMNDMSTKIEGVISKLNKNLENMTEKLSIDGLTGLSLKQTFETDMKKMFMSNASGYVLTIKIDDLGSFAKTNSSKEVNNFIKSFAAILKESNASTQGEIEAYRFYGSEFAIIAKGLSYEKTQDLTAKINEEFEKLSIKVNKSDIAHIGATPFNPIGTTPEMLDSANEAYQTAKQVGPNEVHIRDENDLARDMEAWKELIFDIIDNGKFTVSFIGDALRLNGEDEGRLLMQEAFTRANDKEDKQIPIGTFVSIAEKYDKVIDFDKAVIEKVINHMHTNHVKHDISINLSLDSIKNGPFINWVKTIINRNQSIASQLIFSITAYGVAKDVEHFRQFANEIHNVGAKIIIKRFETKFIPLDNIKGFNLDYIRLARDYTNDISQDSSKEGFVEALQELSSLLNIKVFAENIKSDDDYEYVKRLNLYGASR